MPDELRTPHTARLAPSTPGYDAILAAHEEAIVEREPGYLDPVTGLFVMTAHQAKGRACRVITPCAPSSPPGADREQKRRAYAGDVTLNPAV